VTSLILRIRIQREPPPASEGAAPDSGPSGSPSPLVPQPKGMSPGAAARRPPVPRRPAAQFVPASRAFDVAKRQQMLAAQAAQRAQEAQAPAPAANAPGGSGTPSGPDGANGNTGTPPPPAPQAPKASAPQRQLVPPAGRNDPCPCGSGQKYKKCHGRGA
jgi:hypothetical protein